MPSFYPLLSISLSLSLSISFSDDRRDSEARKELLGKSGSFINHECLCSHQLQFIQPLFWINIIISLSDECRNSEVRKELLDKFGSFIHSLFWNEYFRKIKIHFCFLDVKNITTLIILNGLISYLLFKGWCMINFHRKENEIRVFDVNRYFDIKTYKEVSMNFKIGKI